MSETLELLSDINKVIEAINDEVDSYIGTFTASSKAKREFMKKIYLRKKKRLAKLAKQMYLKWRNP